MVHKTYPDMSAIAASRRWQNSHNCNSFQTAKVLILTNARYKCVYEFERLFLCLIVKFSLNWIIDD